MQVRCVSTGFALPPRIETAAELAPRIGRSAEWIVQRTGVARRRIAECPVEVLAADAARAALGDGPPPDLLINASVTPRQLLPDTSAFVLRELGFSGIPGFSVHASCLSFVVGMHNAAALIQSGAYRRILVVSAERATAGRNVDEPESAALLGDGAAAAVFEPHEGGSELEGWRMATFPAGVDFTSILGCGLYRHPNDAGTTPTDNLFHMNGLAVFKFAVRRAGVFVRRFLDDHGLTVDDIDLVVPHQASGPALEALSRFGFPADRVQNVIAETGNCVAASLPLALAMADADGRLTRGDRVLMLGTGAGLSVAGALWRW